MASQGEEEGKVKARAMKYSSRTEHRAGDESLLLDRL